MDKYFKIQKVVEVQKERKEKLEQVFGYVLGFLPKYDLEFINQNKLNYKNMTEEFVFLLKIKIKDRSSIKFIISQKKENILEEYSKIFPQDILTIV